MEFCKSPLYDTYRENPAKRPRCLLSTKQVYNMWLDSDSDTVLQRMIKIINQYIDSYLYTHHQTVITY